MHVCNWTAGLLNLLMHAAMQCMHACKHYKYICCILSKLIITFRQQAARDLPSLETQGPLLNDGLQVSNLRRSHWTHCLAHVV